MSQAQFGLKLGAGLASIHGDKAVETMYDGSIISPMAGITYHLTFGPIGVKPELMLVRKGASGSMPTDYDITGTVTKTSDYTLSAWYLDAPLLGSFSILPTLSIIAGPSIGYFLTGSEKLGSESHSISSSDIASLNIGAVAGIQFMLPIAGLGIDARYQRGFTTMDKKGDFDLMTDGIQITATYLF